MSGFAFALYAVAKYPKIIGAIVAVSEVNMLYAPMTLPTSSDLTEFCIMVIAADAWPPVSRILKDIAISEIQKLP